MDVRMPDGTIITNVPEGTTKAQLMAKLGQAPEQPSFMRASAIFPIGVDERILAFPTKSSPLCTRDTILWETLDRSISGVGG